MKKNSGALISPEAHGWRLVQDGIAVRYATLGEAAAALPMKTALHLALPCHAALLERLRFPATDREELAGMLQLQLEKTLPYPVEEVSSDFDVIDHGDAESTVLSVAAHSRQLDEICRPLRDQSRLPQKITLFAMHVAAACPPDQTVLAIYAEQDEYVVAICENGKLSWAQTVHAAAPADLPGELPQVLLAAEMEGVPTDCASVQLDRDLAELEVRLRDLFDVPVELLTLDNLPEPSGNLVPAAWYADLRRLDRAEAIKQNLLLAAVLYLLAVAVAFVYLAWEKRSGQKVADAYAAAQPQIEFIQSRERRWNDLRLAVDPRLYTVEVLYQAHKNLPSSEVRITSFLQTGGRWTIVGEAPSANAAIEYTEKMKADQELDAWKVSSAPPTILNGEHARFSVEGRL